MPGAVLAANSQVKDFWDDVPNCLSKHEDIFNASFNTLPEHQPWDHTIELEEGATPASCKVYPILLLEQAKLDAFLQEHLASAHI